MPETRPPKDRSIRYRWKESSRAAQGLCDPSSSTRAVGRAARKASTEPRYLGHAKQDRPIDYPDHFFSGPSLALFGLSRRCSAALHGQKKVGLVSDAQPDVQVALRGLQTHLQGSAARREAHRRLFVRPPARHPPSGAYLRHAKLPVLLCKHLPMGDSGTCSVCNSMDLVECSSSYWQNQISPESLSLHFPGPAAVEGSLFADEREDGTCHTECHSNLHGNGEALFLFVRRSRQDIRRPVPYVATGPARSGNCFRLAAYRSVFRQSKV